MIINSFLIISCVLGMGSESPASTPVGPAGWPDERRQAQDSLEKILLDKVDPKRLRAWHDLLASEPHPAGSPGDTRQIERLATAFEEMGLEVERHEFWPLLSRPIESHLAIVSPDPVDLQITERVLDEDPYTRHPELNPGWNAFSGTGDVTAGIVYANYGTRADFERLAELGIDCTGRIVIARYGRNYRGYKAKFAEAAGAVGLIIYTDPGDSGYARGLMYPEGGYANATSIQRGSIKTLDYAGDPLTPFVEASAQVDRLDEHEIALPRIPVQPIGWGAAQEIMQRMTGDSVPSAWQGGMPLRYRLTGGDALKVRLKVTQERGVTKTANVLATLRGSKYPEQHIILGCHHDGWGFGAGDPVCGLITVMEAARVLSEAAGKGQRPERSITFAAWGAEEFGIIGSVEYVESRLQHLRDNCIAYFNLDMAAMGPRFGSSSFPSLQHFIADTARTVPSMAAQSETNVFDQWFARSVNPTDASLPRFGDIGGGSDHIGFVALAGVPCASLGSGGSAGVSYHSNYDTLKWYRQVVGDDYEPARMVTRMAALVAGRLANAPLLPLDPGRVGPETRRHLEALTRRGRERGVLTAGEGSTAIEFVRIEAAALHYARRASRIANALRGAVSRGTLGGEALGQVNSILMQLDRAWLHASGIPGRPWFQNLYSATDEDSGYSAWMLPALRYAIEHEDRDLVFVCEKLYLGVFKRLNERLDALETFLMSTVEG